MRSNRLPRARRLGLALAVMLLPCLALGVARADTADGLKREGVWAQSYVDRPADPAVRFGQLANGMRYAIRHNATPAGHTSLRLRIGSGSLAEREDQQGLAHFLEHMAFRGSTHVPSGDMVRMLQRLGLTFGADTNAHTGLDETVYQFDLPQSDRDTTDTGLMLLREIAGELTLAQSGMDPERGVVLSEERVRDGPGYRQAVAELMFEMEGQLAPRRMAIGKAQIIRDAPVALIRDYYEAEYRPDNATVVAVGDFDAAEMETAIRARFGDWVAKAPAPPAPDLGAVEPRGATARMLVEPGVPLSLSITWVAPYDAAADTAARERRDLTEVIALEVLNERLDRLAQGADAPFLSASVGRDNVLKSAKITTLQMQPKPGAWPTALEAAITAERRLAEYGVRPDEAERMTTKIRTQLRVAADGAATQPSNQIADAIVRAVNDDEVYTNPGQDLAEAEAMLATLDGAEIDAAARRLFAGSGPLVFLAGPTPVAGGEAAIAAVVAAAQGRQVTAEAAAAAKIWPYTSAATLGEVASRTRIADLDVTEVRFSNGVRLFVKQTGFAADEVLVRVRIGTGRLGISGDKARATWMVSGVVPLLRLGGTRELTDEEIQALTVGNRVGMNLALEDDAFVLGGTTRPADLDTQMQLLLAYTVQPGLRDAAFARVKASVLNWLPQIQATASGVFGRESGPALHGGDPRWRRIPDAAELTTAGADDLAALIGDDFAAGPIEVTVVGDVATERAIDAVARSFGALPSRPARLTAGSAAGAVQFLHTDAAALVVRHGGRADQAMALAAWPTADFYADPQTQRVLGVTAAILQSRLTDRLRVLEGVTYSPSVDTDTSRVFKGLGDIRAVVETPVGKVDNFYTELDRIVAALQAEPPSSDEMDRAKRPMVDERMKLMRENEYWLTVLSLAQGNALQLDAIRDYVSATEQVTAADVEHAARRFLTKATEFRMVVRPDAAK